MTPEEEDAQERLRQLLEYDYPAWEIKRIPRTGGGIGWWAYLRRELVPGDYDAGVVLALARESGSALAAALCAQGELLWQRRAGEHRP